MSERQIYFMQAAGIQFYHLLLSCDAVKPVLTFLGRRFIAWHLFYTMQVLSNLKFKTMANDKRNRGGQQGNQSGQRGSTKGGQGGEGSNRGNQGTQGNRQGTSQTAGANQGGQRDPSGKRGDANRGEGS